MERPLLQTKVVTEHGLRTLAPLGEWEDWIFSEEIKKYSELGYQFKVLKGYTFGKKIIFRNYIEQLYEIKENLSRNNDKSNPMYMISKLLMNSLYGRFGMNTNFPKHAIVNEKELQDLIIKKNLIDVVELGHNRFIVSHFNEYNWRNEIKDWYDTGPNVNIAIAASITASARLFMAKWIADPSLTVGYMDTDCLVIKHEDLYRFNINSMLGGFSIDYKWKEVIFIAPKAYGGLDYLDNVKIKVKGYQEKISWEDFKLLNFEQTSITLDQSKIHKNLTGFMEIRDTIYTLRATENKRKIIYDPINSEAISTKPYNIIQDPLTGIKTIVNEYNK